MKLTIDANVWVGALDVSDPFAATLFLRGADAIYVAIAHLSDAVLLTYDAEVIKRVSKTIRVMTPDSWLDMCK